MNWRKHFLEATTLIVAAAVCALTANAVASRERKLVVVPGEVTGSVPPAAERPSGAPPPPAVAPIETTSAAEGGGAPLKTKPTTDHRQPTTPKASFNPHPDKPYIEIHYDAVAILHAAGALFLDARRTSVYEE